MKLKLAVFDFDGTVLRGNTWHLFFAGQLREYRLRAPWLLTALAIRRTRLVSAEWLQNQALAPWRGQSRQSVEAAAEAFYREQLRPRLREAAMTEIARHRAQGDEVVYVCKGSGVLETEFGDLPFGEGDYLVLHRGLMHRYQLNTDEQAKLLVFESRGHVCTPHRYRNEFG